MNDIENVTFENCVIGVIKSFEVIGSEDLKNPIVFKDCVFENGVSVEIKVNPDSIVEVNGLKMREKSNLKVRKALDSLQINNICIGVGSTLNLNPRNKVETEASLTNCWVLNGSTWTILEPLTYKNREIDGEVVSAPEHGGFRMLGQK